MKRVVVYDVEQKKPTIASGHSDKVKETKNYIEIYGSLYDHLNFNDVNLVGKYRKIIMVAYSQRQDTSKMKDMYSNRRFLT
jgi:hypothetical protein